MNDYNGKENVSGGVDYQDSSSSVSPFVQTCQMHPLSAKNWIDDRSGICHINHVSPRPDATRSYDLLGGLHVTHERTHIFFTLLVFIKSQDTSSKSAPLRRHLITKLGIPNQ